MLQQQTVGDHSVVPDPWSGWAQVVDLPASVDDDLEQDEDVVDAAGPDREATSMLTPRLAASFSTSLALALR